MVSLGIIKTKDRKKLEEIIEILKKNNLGVSLAGSSCLNTNYRDIDLVTVSLDHINEKEQFRYAMKDLKEKYGDRMEVVGCEISDGLAYVGSIIQARCQFELDGTLFDICHSEQQPFGLNPDAEHIDL